MMETLIDRLKKIEALAKGGLAGERENAQRMLDELCARYGVTLEQLADQEKRMHWFPVRGKRAKELFRVVLVHVVQTRQIWHRPKADGYECKLTTAQAADVRECWKHYRKAWDEQIDDVFTAFIHRNRIYGPPKDSDDEQELNAEQRAAAERVMDLMRGMQPKRWDRRAKLEGRAA
jgi:hypothetical protein